LKSLSVCILQKSIIVRLLDNEFATIKYSQSILSLSVEPDTLYYHRGDLLGFTVTVTNNSDSILYFQGWTAGETPWGMFLSPLLGPINVYLGSHQAISPHITQLIPTNTPYGGPYIYKVLAGTYPESIWAEDSFEFFVVPPGLKQDALSFDEVKLSKEYNN